MKIPEKINDELRNLAKYELLADMKQHCNSTENIPLQINPQEATYNTPMQQAEGDENDGLLENCELFDNKLLLNNNPEFGSNKRERIDLVCSVNSHRDMTFEEGDLLIGNTLEVQDDQRDSTPSRAIDA